MQSLSINMKTLINFEIFNKKNTDELVGICDNCAETNCTKVIIIDEVFCSFSRLLKLNWWNDQKNSNSQTSNNIKILREIQ